MPTEHKKPYNFASVYNCGMRAFSNLTQKGCVNSLLTYSEPKDGQIRNLSDTVCSNYVKGKTDLGDDLRIELLSLDLEDVKQRLSNAGIENSMIAAKSLRKLVEISNLSREDTNELLTSFEKDDTNTFLAKALYKSFRPSNYCMLSKEDLEYLRQIRFEVDSSKNMSDYTDTEFSYTITDKSDIDDEDDEDTEWLQNYLSGASINSLTFVRSELDLSNREISLPIDYPAMIYSLKPTIMDGAIEAFEFDEFVNNMDIDTVKHITRTGHLEYWVIKGKIESIEALIPKLNFYDVSDFAFQLIGKFVLKKVRKMQEKLLNTSNKHATLLSTLVNDKDAELVELRLITHVCEDKVIQQYTAAGEDIVRPYFISGKKPPDKKK